MDGTKNLMVPRSEKSVWDKPSLSTSLSAYDQERWLMATWGSALVDGRASAAGGFAGGLTALLGRHPGRSRGDGPARSARRAALGRPHAHRARLVRQGCRAGRLRGVVSGQRLAVLDSRLRRDAPAIARLLSSGTLNRDVHGLSRTVHSQ